MADAQVSKTCARKGVRVQVPPPAPLVLQWLWRVTPRSLAEHFVAINLLAP